MEKVKIWGGQYNVYPYFYPLLVDGEYLGEDFAFCHRLKLAGIKLYSDTRIKLSHIGKYSYSYNFLNSGIKEEPTTVNYIQNEDLKFS
jgi:GT2 family glycosyltransferase